MGIGEMIIEDTFTITEGIDVLIIDDTFIIN